MAKIYITLEVEAKDKLEAASKVQHIINNRNDLKISGIASTDPYEIID